MSNKLLLEASGIHRVERWGGMEPQEGKLGNIDHLTPGMIGISDTNNPVTHGALSYRAATGVAPYNNSWNWNLHYRFAASYITGSHAFKVGFNNAYLHHENTTYSSPAAPIVYNFTAMSPTGITYRLTPRTVKVNVDHDLGLFVQDKWTFARWTLAGAIRWDSFANSFPEQALSRHLLRADLQHLVPGTGQPELERHHAAAVGHLRRVRERQDGVEDLAEQVPRRAGHDRVRGGTGDRRAEPDPSAADRFVAPLGRRGHGLQPRLRSEQLQRQRRVRCAHRARPPSAPSSRVEITIPTS